MSFGYTRFGVFLAVCLLGTEALEGLVSRPIVIVDLAGITLFGLVFDLVIAARVGRGSATGTRGREDGP